MIYIIVVLLALFLAIISRHRKQRRIKKWFKKLNLNHHLRQFYQLFYGINGFLLSKQARSKNDSISYVYGEIDFISFIALIDSIKPHNKTVFYDLGSGVGKAVCACAMVFEMEKCYGIELFAELHQVALQQQNKLQKLPDYFHKAKCIKFIRADLLDHTYADATLIFINASAFFGDYWQEISNHLDQVQSETIIISTSKLLKSKLFILLKTTEVQMSWGVVTAYIQKRI